MAVGIWQVSDISWCPAELLMLMRALNPFDTQRSYRARKPAVAVAVLTAVAAGSGGLDGVPVSDNVSLGGRVGNRHVLRDVAVNVDRPSGSALLPPSPPGGEGNMASAGLGVCLLTGRGGLLTTGVSS
jgi:hypothetical protein